MGNKKFQKVIVIIMAVLMLLSAISMGLTMIL
ncbi:stressosome-associated protein Prli42 [Kurthia massiliensis]|nr:stressosome-associated protein Prli42 [Kurthia massiliensis]